MFLVNIYDCFSIELFWDIFYSKQIIYESYMAVILKYYNLEETHYNLVELFQDSLESFKWLL